MHQPTDRIAAALDRGEVLWPGAHRVHDVQTDEDTIVELLSGRRRFMTVDDDAKISPRVGDLVAFYIVGQEAYARVFVVTLLTEPSHLGFLIASLRPVRLAVGE